MPLGFIVLEVLCFREKDLVLFYLGLFEICNASKPCYCVNTVENLLLLLLCSTRYNKYSL